jgi:transposase-like protein
VNEYSEDFKANMVRKMVGEGCMSAHALALETGLNQSTLSRWLRSARTVGVMNMPAKKWTAAEKLRVVVETSKLGDDALGEFLRREGLHAAEVVEWRALAEGSFVEVTRSSKASPEAKRVKDLERELLRKDKALAEAAALLILQKKVQAFWAERDDATTGKNGR